MTVPATYTYATDLRILERHGDRPTGTVPYDAGAAFGLASPSGLATSGHANGLATYSHDAAAFIYPEPTARLLAPACDVPAAPPSTMVYDRFGAVCEPEHRSTTYAYDSLGKACASADGALATCTYWAANDAAVDLKALFAALLRDHRGAAFAVIVAKLPPSLWRDAEDVLQEAYCDVWRAMHRADFVPGREFGLLLHAAKCRRIDVVNRLRRCRVIYAADLADELAFEEVLASHPCSDAADAEECARLWSKLELFHGRRRIVAEVYFTNVDSFHPRATYSRLAALVSERTGQPENVGTVKSTWHAVCNVLRQEMAHDARG
jgi:DNA-directed RNA polymerase specialized sigma24 family protein